MNFSNTHVHRTVKCFTVVDVVLFMAVKAALVSTFNGVSVSKWNERERQRQKVKTNMAWCRKERSICFPLVPLVDAFTFLHFCFQLSLTKAVGNVFSLYTPRARA